ncbi:cysteine desulfurase family protein [Desulfitobacterium hafniense DCB-2]|uniref:cysteine desulfurase n=1 Tax=Desulfitobacterium hafniense (strain DSM 10664 / DCB-2) TaxID=272564 RepID=B8G161_DESHD|nr:aminotransferase class V-fold PLP-dependent enzyme [Desulfitobacterium hafniense]ACL19276.1 cysteine desulfurase family protein [Desulfitobacterium hafniense DCB-2]
MIYLDNAATTWPKPPEVVQAMADFMINMGGNSGRGTHSASIQAANVVFDTRVELAELFGLKNPSRIAFTSNATHAINQALVGLLYPGDHVITSSLEHNAVVRPLKALERYGVSVTEVSGEPGNEFSLEHYRQSFQKNTKCVITLHASNVTGTLLPIEEIGKIAGEHGVKYIVDAAQTAGVFDIDLETLPIDILTFPGHKGLLGPQGTGGLALREGVNLKPLIYGGTGSLSESENQPDFLPDALESGTLNGVGIAGLGASVQYLRSLGLHVIRKRELELCQQLIDGLSEIPEVKIYGENNALNRAPIVSFNIGSLDSMFVADRLDQVYGIRSRAGMHCAPHAHRMFKTISQGVIRFSPSHFTQSEEIAEAIQAVRNLAKEFERTV